jgi:hypothetical protein
MIMLLAIFFRLLLLSSRHRCVYKGLAASNSVNRRRDSGSPCQGIRAASVHGIGNYGDHYPFADAASPIYANSSYLPA